MAAVTERQIGDGVAAWMIHRSQLYGKSGKVQKLKTTFGRLFARRYIPDENEGGAAAL